MNITKLRSEFNNRQRHEQLLLMALVACVTLWLLSMLVLKPLNAKQNQLERQNHIALENLTRARQLTAEYQQLMATGTIRATTTRSRQNLSNIIDASVAANNLTMRRYQPSASGMAQVRFENMPFEQIIAWLHDIEFKHGLIVQDLSITQGNSSGLVNLSVRLEQNS